MDSWGVRSVASLVTWYARLCLRSSRFEIPEASREVLARTWDDARPTTYVYWHDEFVLNVLLPLHWRAARVRDAMPVCGANDAFGGRVIRACLGSLGVPLALLPRRSDRDAKRRVLAGALREHRRLLLAADYGAPWFRARPTAWQLARETEGRVVAMHLAARRDARLAWGAWRLRLPLPFNRYELRLAAVEAAPDADETALAAALTRQLDALRARHGTAVPRPATRTDLRSRPAAD